jgi:transcriptional regulator with XRE-family HTH domain
MTIATSSTGIKPMMGLNIARFSAELKKQKAVSKSKKELSKLDQGASEKAYELYQKSGKTQAEIAEIMGVSQGNLSQYLSGVLPIGSKTLAKLCSAFHCMPYDIRSEFRDAESETELSLINKRIKGQNKLIESLVGVIKNTVEHGINLDSFGGVLEKAHMSLSGAYRLESSAEQSFDASISNKNIINEGGYRLSQSDIDAAKRVNELYKEMGVTQSSLAKRMNISQGNLSQYLNGKMPFGIKTLLRFCSVFNCQPGDIRAEYRDISIDNELSSAIIHVNNQKSIIADLLAVVAEKCEKTELTSAEAESVQRAGKLVSFQ